jgi:hypothetical protein
VARHRRGAGRRVPRTSPSSSLPCGSIRPS